MSAEEAGLLKNSVFLILTAFLVVLLYIYQSMRLRRSQKKDKDKIVGFFPRGLGLIPVRESFYLYWDRKQILSIVVFSLFFVFLPIFWGGYVLAKEGFNGQVLAAMIGMPIFFFAVLFYGWLYRRAKEARKDLTGAEMNLLGLANLVRQEKDSNLKAVLKWELAGTIVAVGLMILYILNTLEWI